MSLLVDLGPASLGQNRVKGAFGRAPEGDLAEAGHPGQDRQEELKDHWGHRMELWLPGRGCAGGRVGADREQAAGPSTGKTVCSKKLNKSSSQRGWKSRAHRGKAAGFSKTGALWRARSRGGGSRREKLAAF